SSGVGRSRAPHASGRRTTEPRALGRGGPCAAGGDRSCDSFRKGLGMTTTLPLIPTSVIGSHGKPGWWFLADKAFEAGELGPADVKEWLDDAADTAIRDMERADVDVITDGEVRRLDGYVDSYYRVIRGIRPVEQARRVGPWGYDQQTRYRAVGRIEAPDGGLGIVKEFTYLKGHTERSVKATCAGPL